MVNLSNGGVDRSRTDLEGFAALCLAAWLPRLKKKDESIISNHLIMSINIFSLRPSTLYPSEALPRYGIMSL